MRAAAAATLDVVNAGWQNFKATEERWDDSLKSPRARRPLPSATAPASRQPISSIWNRHFTYDDLLPDVGRQGHGRRSTVEGAGKPLGNAPRYTGLAGFKYCSYNDALRQERVVARFEAAQQEAVRRRTRRACGGEAARHAGRRSMRARRG